MSEFVERRYATIVDALNTEDRRGRGYISIDRCLEIYLLYFNASAGELLDHELAAFVEPFTHDAPERTLPGAPTLRVVDYMAFAGALAERDQKFVDEKPTATRPAAPGLPPSSGYQHVSVQRVRSPGGTPFTSPPRGRTRPMADGTGHRLPALSPLGVQEAALVREDVRPPDKLEQRFGRRPRNQLTSLGDAGDTAFYGGSDTPLSSSWSGGEGYGSYGSPPVLKPAASSWGRRYGEHGGGGGGGGGDSWGSDAGEVRPFERRSSGDSWGGGSSAGWGGGGSSSMLSGSDGWGEGGVDGAAALTRALAASDWAGTGSMLQAQLLMLCRAHGVTTSTEELRGLMDQSLSQGEGSISRVDYHLFVSRLEQSHGRGRRGGYAGGRTGAAEAYAALADATHEGSGSGSGNAVAGRRRVDRGGPQPQASTEAAGGGEGARGVSQLLGPLGAPASIARRPRPLDGPMSPAALGGGALGGGHFAAPGRLSSPRRLLPQSPAESMSPMSMMQRAKQPAASALPGLTLNGMWS